MQALLDVNVLIALLDSDHLHHARAVEWLKENIHVRLDVLSADSERLHPHHVANRLRQRSARRRSCGAPRCGNGDNASRLLARRCQHA